MQLSILDRLKSDLEFRTKIFLYISIIVNILYSIFLIVASILYNSKWFLTISIYYALLSVARIVLVGKFKKKQNINSQIMTMRTCGYFLLAINLVVSTMMFILINGNPTTKHHEIIVITLATYTFASLTMAIITAIKHIKLNNYIYSCVKVISLTSAIVSMVTLTDTMLIAFGEENNFLRSIILPILCSVVAILIIVGALIMIFKANSDLRKLKDEK